MRIAYVFQDQYPWDIRADKITDSLAQAGHRTFIVSRNRTGLPQSEQLRDNLIVRRLPGVSPAFLRHLLNFPAFFSPVWLWVLYRTVVVEKIDLIIVRDLPMGPAAWFIGKLCAVPVVMDMAEDYPAMIQDTWDHRGPAPLDFVLRNPKILRVLESWLLPRLDGVLVVSPASGKRVESLVSARGVPVHVTQNTPRLSAVATLLESDLSQRMQAIAHPKILYVGGLEEMRGLAIVVEAMPSLIQKLGAITLVIVGEGTSRAGLERRVSELGLTAHVIFAGWIEQKYVPGLIAVADIGIVPHLVTGHTNTTLPNKIYDYMAQGKPVVVTHADSLREMVETYACGKWYEDKNSAALANTISALLTGGQKTEMGKNGERAITEQLNWERDAQGLIAFATSLVQKHSATTSS